MKWNPNGLVIATIATVIKTKLPPEISITWGSLVEAISAALSDIKFSETTPKEMFEKKFERCMENLLLSPSVGFEIGEYASEIIEDLAKLDFQFDSDFSQDTAVNNIRMILSNHKVYDANIDDKLLFDLANSIYIDLENIVQENVQALSYYTLKRLKKLESKVSQQYEELTLEGFAEKWITKRAVEPSYLYVPLDQEHDIINNLQKNNKIAITGTVGGVGKTELARHLCQEISENYKYIGWINYSGNLERDISQSLTSQFFSQGHCIDRLFAFDSYHANELILFVDNISSEALSTDASLSILRQLSCSIVITTRAANIFDFLAFEVKTLSLEKAELVFEHYYTGRPADNYTHNETVAHIVKLSGYHPLLIELIARNARKRHLSRRNTLSELQDKGFSLAGNAGSNWNSFKNESIIAQLGLV